MPNLPLHLQPRSYLANYEPYSLRHPWPDDCMVSWGRQSVENGQPKPADSWALFEVKLREPQTFFTRDGDNFADAEDKAYEHLGRIRACPHHEFERRGFRNGVGFCLHCDLCSPYALEPLESCALCGCTTYFAQRGKKSYCESHAPDASFLQAVRAEGEKATPEFAKCELEVAVAHDASDYRGESSRTQSMQAPL